ncbi:MAG: MFS transporter [Proteobacteria bacterium]|nr:MFS transporter [Pseudomonadota bacterium]
MWLTKLRGSAPGRALRHRNFRLFITGNLVSLLGTRIHEIAAGWLVWTLTESATWLGALAIAQTLPRILLWPIAGVLADRMDRRRMAFIFQSIAFLGAGSLALVNALELIQVWMIVLVHAVLGVCQGFWQPSRMALLSQVVPREDMTPAVAVNSVGAQSSRILGPALAGLIIIYAGPTTAFAVNAFTFLAVIGALSLMTLAPGRASRAARTGMIRESLDGMRYIANHPGIGPLILIVLIFCVSVRPIIDLFPAFADVNFARGAGGLSALNAMLGLGAVLGGIWASWRSGLRGLTALLAWSSGVGGAATLLFALTDSFPFALVCVVFRLGNRVAGHRLADPDPDRRGRRRARAGVQRLWHDLRRVAGYRHLCYGLGGGPHRPACARGHRRRHRHAALRVYFHPAAATRRHPRDPGGTRRPGKATIGRNLAGQGCRRCRLPGRSDSVLAIRPAPGPSQQPTPRTSHGPCSRPEIPR